MGPPRHPSPSPEHLPPHHKQNCWQKCWQGCWQRFCQKICGKSSRGRQNGVETKDTKYTNGGQKAADAEAKNKNSDGQTFNQNAEVQPEKRSGSLELGDKKIDATSPETVSSHDETAKTKPVDRRKQSESFENKQQDDHGTSIEKILGSHGVGDKMDSKLPDTLGSSIQDVKAKGYSNIEPGQSLQKKKEKSYGSVTEKSEGSPGVGDKNTDSKLSKTEGSSARDPKAKTGNTQKTSESQGFEDKKRDPKVPETLGSSVQDIKEKTGSNHQAGQSLQTLHENSYESSTLTSNGSHGVGDEKLDSKVSVALGSSVQVSKVKSSSRIEPGKSLQNKQENSYRSAIEKSKGSPGVGDKNMDSKLSKSSDQDAKAKAASIEKSNGSSGVEDKKMDSKQPETFSNSVQDPKEKTGSSLKAGQSLQNEQETSYSSSTEKRNGSLRVGEKKMGSTQAESLGSSDQDAKTKSNSSLEPGQSLQSKQGNSMPEQLIHKFSQGAARQQFINENDKDANPPKAANKSSKPQSEQEQKEFFNQENNSESKAKKMIVNTEHADLLPRNDKKKAG